MMSLELTFGSHQSLASVGLWAVTLTGCEAVLVIHRQRNFLVLSADSKLPRDTGVLMTIQNYATASFAFTSRLLMSLC